MSPFAAVTDRPSPAAWVDLARLAGPTGEMVLFRDQIDPPPGWTVVWRGAGVQMVGASLDGVADPAAVPLGPEHAAEMLALVARTQPGPFLPRTPVLGPYLGIRDDTGALVAMAGTRLHFDGWTEISAVCTDPDHRGLGLGTRLVRAVGALIADRGETPFLHAASTNTSAIRLYEGLGFTHRRQVVFAQLRPPEVMQG